LNPLEPPPQVNTWGWVWTKWLYGLWAEVTDRIFPNGGDYGWTDYLSSISTGKVAGANTPTWSAFRGNIDAYEFDNASMNEVWMVFHINHDYKEGTGLYPHVHWSPNTTNTGVVRWGFEYMYAKGHSQGSFPASTTVYVEETISSSSQYLHIISEVSDANVIPSTNMETDGIVLMRLFRDAAHVNDTFPDPVHGFFVDLHVQVDKIATRNKAPDFFR
jgi:hypothetical protein